MPIYEFVCQDCGVRFEEILSFADSEKPRDCPDCAGVAAKVMSASYIRMTRICDNAEYGPRAFFGEEHAKHEKWKELAEESQMVQRKRDQLESEGKLNDFVFEEGEFATEPGQKAKTISEV